jgi:hypothetical protein
VAAATWVDFLTVRFRSDATPMDCLGPVPEPPGGAFCRLAAGCDASSSACEAVFCGAIFGKTARMAFNACEFGLVRRRQNAICNVDRPPDYQSLFATLRLHFLPEGLDASRYVK